MKMPCARDSGSPGKHGKFKKNMKTLDLSDNGQDAATSSSVTRCASAGLASEILNSKINETTQISGHGYRISADHWRAQLFQASAVEAFAQVSCFVSKTAQFSGFVTFFLNFPCFPKEPESRAQGIFIQNQAGTPGAPPREPEDPGNILEHYSNSLARIS